LKFSLLFLVLALVCFPLLPPKANAQEAVKFNSLEIDLWPEYDRPSLLVINRGILASSVTLPAQLTVRIPAAAGSPTALASGATLDSVADTEANVKIDGEWAEVSFLATGPAIQMEYYDPGLKKEGDARSFTFIWPGTYAVDSLSIQVQQPIDATQMQIKPAFDPGAAGQDGLVYYNKEVGALAAGEQLSIEVGYQKSTDTLSAPSLPVEPSAPVTSSGDLRGNMMTALLIAIGALGVILIVGGGLWYWQSGRSQVGRANRVAPRRRKPASSKEAGSGPAGGFIYCHNCGKRAGPGDRFCRTCGTKLRME
jgi:hypothetical protein